MKLPLCAFATFAALGSLGLAPAVAHADPPVSCTVKLPTGAIFAGFDYATMTGTVTADGTVGTRRFKVKAVPANATYSLVFLAYGTGDQKPAAEKLTVGTSIVARLVSFGDVQHLMLDMDYHPPSVRASMDGFVCK